MATESSRELREAERRLKSVLSQITNKYAESESIIKAYNSNLRKLDQTARKIAIAKEALGRGVKEYVNSEGKLVNTIKSLRSLQSSRQLLERELTTQIREQILSAAALAEADRQQVSLAKEHMGVIEARIKQEKELAELAKQEEASQVDYWTAKYKHDADLAKEAEKSQIEYWTAKYKHDADLASELAKQEETSQIEYWTNKYKHDAELAKQEEKSQIEYWTAKYKHDADLAKEAEASQIEYWTNKYKHDAEIAKREEEEHINYWLKKYKQDEATRSRNQEDQKFLERSRSKIVQAFNKLSSAADALINSIRNIQQQLGIVAADAATIGFDNLAGSIDSFMSALLPGGKSGAPVTPAQILKAQTDFQNQFGEILDPTTAQKFAQQAIEFGITTEQLAQARRVFMTQTMGNVGSAINAQNKFVDEFRKKGLSTKVAMETIAQYSELLARNGTRFATSFARAAADAKKIGVDLSKVDQIGDSIISDFEGFLEKSAELGAMGFGFDTNKLAQLAETGDTGALLDELRSQLASTGKDITKLRRSEQLALSDAFGIPMSELLKLAGGPGGSGEKTIEQLTAEGNTALSSAVDFLQGVAGAIGITNGLLIAANTLLGIISINTGGLGGLGGKLLTGLKIGLGSTGVGTALGGGLLGREYVKKGETGKGIGIGTISGLVGGGLLAIATGGAAIPFLAGGALAGSGIAASGLMGKSKGGLITGPGTTTSDSILTRLSNGEYVMRADAVRTIGVDTLDKMNKIPGKALGGLIGTVASRSGLLNGLMSKYVKFGMPAIERVSGMMANIQSMKDKAGGLFGKYTSSEGLMSLVSKSPTVSKLMGKYSELMGGGLSGLASKIPGVGGLLGGGGLQSLGTNLLTKFGLGNVASFAGGPFTMAASLAAPLLKKIPIVGSALGKVTDAPGKLIGSALGKLGGLFGKKKLPEQVSSTLQSVTAKIPGMDQFMPSLETLRGPVAEQPRVAQTQSAPTTMVDKNIEQAIARAVAGAVASALQGVNVKMDGTAVGKILVNATDAAASAGVFRVPSRATL